TRYQDEGYERFRTALAVPGSVRKSIQNVLLDAAKESSARDGSKGCLCVNTAVELGHRDDEIAEILCINAQRCESLFEAALMRGKRTDELRHDLDERPVARFLLTTLFGLYVGGKAPFSERKLKDVVKVAMSVLER